MDVYAGDLQNPEAVDGAMVGREIVLHLGAIPIPYSYKHPREFVYANIDGTINVLEASRSAQVARVVQVSSSEVDGTAKTPDRRIASAEPAVALCGHEGRSPPARAHVPPLLRHAGRHRAAVQHLRATRVRARRDPDDHHAGAHAYRIELGALSPTRDFTFVEDTAAAIAACGIADGVEGETLDFGTGEEHAVGDVATRILELLGRDLAVVATDERRRPRASEAEALIADASKARSMLDWAPATSFEAGLQHTIDWITRSLGEHRPDVYAIRRSPALHDRLG